MSDFKEADLGPLVVQFLQQQGYEIYQEVRMGGVGTSIVDLIGKRGSLLHGVELKKNLSMAVIRQAHRNREDVHFSSVAISARRHRYGHVIRTEDREFAINVCRDYRLGVFEVFMEDDKITETVPAQRIKGHEEHVENTVIPLLHDNQRLNSGFANAGTKGGGYHTPYKEMIGIVKSYIQDNPGCEIMSILAHLGEELRQSRITYVPRSSTLMANLKSVEGSWCIIKRPKGKRTNAFFCM